jgi:hypothetical protein
MWMDCGSSALVEIVERPSVGRLPTTGRAGTRRANARPTTTATRSRGQIRGEAAVSGNLLLPGGGEAAISPTLLSRSSLQARRHANRPADSVR